MSDNQLKKEGKWLYFAIGLVAGFAICILSFVVFSMIQHNSRSFTQTIEHIYKPDNTKDTVIKYVNVVRREDPVKKVDVYTEPSDSVMVDSFEGEADLEEVDFSYADNGDAVNDDVVVVDKMLAQRNVKIQCKDADFKSIPSREGMFDYMEVQQWDTPIKNKISFRYADNILQIKGLPIDKVEIVYYDGRFYLLYGGNYYLLETHDSFEKLGAPVALNPQR